MMSSPTPTRRCASTPCASHSRSSPMRPDMDFDSRLADWPGDPAIRVRLQAALALGDRCRDEPAALDALGKIAAWDADDPWIRLAILSGLAESSLAFLPLCDQVPPASGRAQLRSQAAAIVGVRRRPNELSTLLRMIASRVDQKQVKSGPVRSVDALTMLAGLATGIRAVRPAAFTRSSPCRRRISNPIWHRLAPLWPAASAIAVSKRPSAERLVALDVLSRGRPDLAEEIIPTLLAVTQPGEIQSAAARAVGPRWPALTRAQALDRWKTLAVATRRELLSAVAGSRELAEELIKALEQSTIGPNELDASTREALERLPDATLRRRASTVFAKFTPPRRSEAVARYQAALIARCRSQRGAAVFARNCQTCHQRQGQGHRVGPDLSGIAGRAPDALLIDILDPNREVVPDFVTALARDDPRPGRFRIARGRDRHDLEAPPRRGDRRNYPPIRDRRAALDRPVPDARRTRAIHQPSRDGRPDRVLAPDRGLKLACIALRTLATMVGRG